MAAAGAARGSRSTLTGWLAPRTRSTPTGSSGSPASGACRMRSWRPCSWPTSPTAATCPTGRRSSTLWPGPGLPGRGRGAARGRQGAGCRPGRGGTGSPPRRLGRAVLRRERPGRPVRRPAAGAVSAGVRAGGRFGRSRGEPARLTRRPASGDAERHGLSIFQARGQTSNLDGSAGSGRGPGGPFPLARHDSIIGGHAAAGRDCGSTQDARGRRRRPASTPSSRR